MDKDYQLEVSSDAFEWMTMEAFPSVDLLEMYWLRRLVGFSLGNAVPDRFYS